MSLTRPSSVPVGKYMTGARRRARGAGLGRTASLKLASGAAFTGASANDGAAAAAVPGDGVRHFKEVTEYV